MACYSVALVKVAISADIGQLLTDQPALAENVKNWLASKYGSAESMQRWVPAGTHQWIVARPDGSGDYFVISLRNGELGVTPGRSSQEARATEIASEVEAFLTAFGRIAATRVLQARVRSKYRVLSEVKGQGGALIQRVRV